MEVLMINTVPQIGRKGEFKQVAEGYARNYLFPRKLAVPATEGAKKNFELVKTAWEKQVARERQTYTDILHFFGTSPEPVFLQTLGLLVQKAFL